VHAASRTVHLAHRSAVAASYQFQVFQGDVYVLVTVRNNLHAHDIVLHSAKLVMVGVSDAAADNGGGGEEALNATFTSDCSVELAGPPQFQVTPESRLNGKLLHRRLRRGADDAVFTYVLTPVTKKLSARERHPIRLAVEYTEWGRYEELRAAREAALAAGEPAPAAPVVWTRAATPVAHFVSQRARPFNALLMIDARSNSATPSQRPVLGRPVYFTLTMRVHEGAIDDSHRYLGSGGLYITVSADPKSWVQLGRSKQMLRFRDREHTVGLTVVVLPIRPGPLPLPGVALFDERGGGAADEVPIDLIRCRQVIDVAAA
jgi:hypothetical protein